MEAVYRRAAIAVEQLADAAVGALQGLAASRVVGRHILGRRARQPQLATLVTKACIAYSCAAPVAVVSA